jgi:hypothetical protein
MDSHRHYLVMSYKIRVQKAMEEYLKKQQPKPKSTESRSSKNKTPEKDFVKLILKYLRGLGWSVDVVDSAAVYSKEAGMYLNSMARIGMSDIVGNMPNGIAVFIEAKAQGKRSTVRPDQREFLIAKIDTNCFAIVCDSIEYFDRVFGEWQNSHVKKAYLLKELPQLTGKWADDNEPLF